MAALNIDFSFGANSSIGVNNSGTDINLHSPANFSLIAPHPRVRVRGIGSCGPAGFPECSADDRLMAPPYTGRLALPAPL